MFKRLMLAKMPVLIAQDRLSRADGYQWRRSCCYL